MTKARDLGDFISDGTIAETVTADGLNLGDNEKIQLGASQDLQLYHDGTHSRIDNNQGDLFIQSDTIVRITNSAASETAAKFFVDGAVELYHDNSRKINTSSTGATVTGTIAVSDSFNATSGTFTVQSNGTDILNVTSTLMSPQTDGAISIGSASNAFNDMYLDGSAYVSGNIGIGTSSPNAPTAIVANSSTYEGLELITPTGDGSGEFHIGVHQNGSTGGRSIVFKRGGSDGMDTESMRIDSSGVVRIGGQTGTLKLGNDATYYVDIEWEYNNNELAFTANNTANFTFNSNGSERFRIGSSGQVGLSGANYGTAGQVLTSGGSGAAPTWAAVAGGALFDGNLFQ